MSEFVLVSVTVEGELADLVSKVLEACGATSVTVESGDGQEAFDVATPMDPEWTSSHVAAIFDKNAAVSTIADHLKSVAGRGLEVVVETLGDQDWERSWQQHFEPFSIGNRMWVCPSWCEPPRPEENNLIIDPGLAFGSGTHETTRLCLEFIASEKLEGKKVVDFGCGSGILAIAALKAGAVDAIGVDIDPRALDVSRKNAARNDVGDRYRAKTLEEYKLSGRSGSVDLLFANILADTLLEYAEFLKDKVAENGQILLSGLLEHQAAVVCDHYQDSFGFQVQKLEQWVLLTGSNRTSTVVSR